ncbi:MAG: class I SAM-dependent methyltransferase [Nitrospirae bacterium]|nr:class I SAM-dependent methyltransferase [Nitrospirota bacterium]
MKLSPVVRFMTNSSLRALSQIYIEGPLLRKLATKKEYPLCLEIGCGRGIGARIISEQFGAEKVIATDIDPEQIERAKRSLSPALKASVEFKVEDAMAIDEPDSKFDAVFSFGVIHHTENWRKTIKEVSRVLKPDGEFFFMELLKAITSNSLFARISQYPGGGEFGLKEFENALAAEGLEITGLRHIAGIVALGAARKKR